MEDKKITEKESLELISQMIQNSKKRMEIGSGNHFLFWGYFTAILSATLFSLVTLTGDPRWSIGWFMMFAAWIFIAWKKRKEHPVVVTYTDRIINNVWQLVGITFALTIVTITAFGILQGKASFILMLPLGLLYCGLGVSVTGIIIREPWLIYTPLLAFVCAIYMFMIFVLNESATNNWYLYFGLSFVIMMIIPGHILNNKAHRTC